MAEPWQANRQRERVESVRKVLRVKKQRGLNTVSIERYEDAVNLVNELLVEVREARMIRVRRAIRTLRRFVDAR